MVQKAARRKQDGGAAMIGPPKIDLKQLRADLEQNRKDRLAFIDWYAKWQKKASNKQWSHAQAKLINKTPKRSSRAQRL